MSTDGLTERQTECLQIITRHIEAGKSPTVREIGRELGTRSTSGVHALLIALRDRGKIQWIDARNRSIVLVPDRRAGHVLDPDLQARLERFCKERGDSPGDVIQTALVLHFDDVERVEQMSEAS